MMNTIHVVVHNPSYEQALSKLGNKVKTQSGIIFGLCLCVAILGIVVASLSEDTDEENEKESSE